MKIEIKIGEGLTRELSVEIPAQTVNSKLDEKLTELRRSVSLKGFRRGKAPLNMVRSRYGDQAKADVIDELFRQSLSTAIDENKLKIASRPTVTALDMADDGTLTYRADLEVFPEVEKVDFDGLELRAVELKVEDQEVDDVVEHYRKQFSELRPLDRAAGESDVIVVDLLKVADPRNALAADDLADSEIDLANPVTIKEFREQLPGMKAGDEKEIEVVYDDDYGDPTFAGAHITYDCKVKSVNERLLPDLDDAFAKRTGLAETALELKLKIRKGILKEKESSQRRRHRREIVDLLCKRNDLPIPEGPVGEYLDNLVKDFRERGEEFDEKELRDRYRPVGVRSMRWDILWRTLAEQERIEVLSEDTENWIKSFAAYNGVSVDQAKEDLQKAGRIRELRESILEEKVLSFLIGKASIIPAGM